MKLRFVKLHDDAVAPRYGKLGDAGLDLTAVSVEDKPEHYEVCFGIAIEIPPHYVGLVVPRSGITNMNMMLKNSVGIIDSNYRGELKARFKKVKFEDRTFGNAGVWINGKDYTAEDVAHPNLYKKGDRCAQLVIVPAPMIEPEEVLLLTDTVRGADGFGSTGL